MPTLAQIAADSENVAPNKRGKFDRLITLQRATVTTDDYGGETPTWADVEQAWARIRFGLASEQRQAAQQGGTQAATFEVVPTAALLAVTLKDRISFDGDAWDISEVAPLDRQTLRFTATRAA
jgi:SPP1 family predicted phage head-tail adaptor